MHLATNVASEEALLAHRWSKGYLDWTFCRIFQFYSFQNNTIIFMNFICKNAFSKKLYLK